MAPVTTARWSGWAISAAGVTTTFIAITWWWLSRDHGVPFGDAASHLFTVVRFHDLAREGDVNALLHGSGYYPPLTFLIGAAAMLVGGVNAAAPVIGENLVSVSFLALGCYQVGRRVAGPQAGFLAVVFALGSPLLIEQFHVFMIDAPGAAPVAVAVWLILASERFSRVGVSALAGLAFGLGAESKEQVPLFLIGLLVVVLARERGWRNWRGIAAFAAVACVVALPWYVLNETELSRYASAGLANANLPPRGRPPTLSISNLGWYLWAVVNGLLFAPLFAFVAVGVARTVHLIARERKAPPRERSMGDAGPELLGGLFGGWLALTLTPHHDMRYTMPLIVYLAVLGTAWIAMLAPTPRTIATATLGLAVLATTLGATFGVGSEVRIPLSGHPIQTDASFGIPPPDQLTLYSDHDFSVSSPRRGDDVLGLFKAMRREGITGVIWRGAEAPDGDPVFDSQGVRVFARFAGLAGPRLGSMRLVTYSVAESVEDMNPMVWDVADPRHAFLIRAKQHGHARPCRRLRDGTGIWLVLGNPFGGGRPYCPS